MNIATNSYIKKISSTLVKETAVNADNLIVNNQSLTDQISSIMSEIQADNLLQLNTPSLSGNNTFSGSNSMPSISIPNSISANSTSISLAKLPRLTTSITPTDANDLVTKSYTDSSILDIRPLTNQFTGSSNTFNNIVNCPTLATANNHLTNKSYVDSNISALKSSANNWTSTNSYNVSLPTSIQTPTLNNQLTTKVYVDTTVNNLKSTPNTWSSKQIVNKDLNINTSHAGDYYDSSGNSITPLVITDFDTGNNTNANLSFIVNGTNGFSQLVAATQSVGGAFLRLNTWSNDANGVSIGSNYTRIEGGSNHLTVDKINGITIKSNPKIDSYILPSNDLELVPKKFVDDSIANKKTFITSFGKSPNEGLNVNDSVSSRGIFVVPNAGQGNYNPSVTDNSTAIIARSSTIDTASLCIAPHSNTNTGIQMNMNNINIGCGGLGATAETSININNLSGIQFSKVPILSTDLTSSITDDKCLTTKKYVDSNINSVVNSVSPSVTYMDKAFHFEYFNTTGTKYYGLYYPDTGSSAITGNNSNGWYRNFFINTTKDLLNCTIDLFSWQRINNASVIGGATTRTGGNALLSNINVRQNIPFDPSIYIAGGNNTYFPISSTIVFSFLSGGFYATVIQSNKVGWKNTSQSPQLFQSQYSPTSGVTRTLYYHGLVFSYQGANTVNNPTSYNRIFCSVGYGNIINSPSSNAGSCSEYGYTAKITHNYDAEGVNGAFISQLETSSTQTINTAGW